MLSELPEEDFDVLPKMVRKRGAHRGATRSKFATAAVVVVGVCVLGLSIFVLNHFSFSRNVANNAVIVPTVSATPSSSPTPAVTPSPAPTPTIDTSPTPEVSEVEPEVVAVNRNVPINVFNGTGITGLAASVRQALVTSGWQVSFVGNYEYYPVPPTTVYYSKPSLRSTALAVLNSLGATGVVQESQAFSADLSVVLGSGY